MSQPGISNLEWEKLCANEEQASCNLGNNIEYYDSYAAGLSLLWNNIKTTVVPQTFSGGVDHPAKRKPDARLELATLRYLLDRKSVV